MQKHEMNLSQVHNRYLDMTKGFLAMLIVFTHSAFADNHRDWYIFPLLVDMAVPVFLVISGYVNCISYNTKTIKQYYGKTNIARKIKRITLSCIPIFTLIIVYWLFIKQIGIKWTLINILFQRWGDGGYYPIIMLEFILVFPIIFELSKSRLGIISVFLFNVVSEVSFNLLGNATLIVWLHRISISRYLLFILSGIILFRYKERITTKITIATMVIGFSAVFVLRITQNDRSLFKLWRSTSFIVAPWAASWIMLIIRLNNYTGNNKLLGLFEKLGRASYEVFLIQMLWYFLIENKVIKEPIIVVSLFICLVFGYFYYLLSNVIIKKWRIQNG